ncbi:AraC family transcriptional regulator [Streptococcus suis]|uniref:AraC family transcriptional regulator n=1 Tax=Streptococcus suis TaxID=1307 RepID=UPI001E4C9C97|nr:AraC family transcriptional regulator [Streptococcus suis]
MKDLNINILENFLYEINEYEKKQKETGLSINDYPFQSDTSKDTYIDPAFKVARLPKEIFFTGGSSIFLSRHNRFAPMITHLHDFIEMVYVYNGHCTQEINGETVSLSKGDLIVLDRDVPHSINALGEEDILINILLNEETFDTLFLYKLQDSSSILTQFLADAFNTQAKHDKFIIFHTNKSSTIHSLIQLMLCEHLDNKMQAQLFLFQYLQILLMELIRIYQEENIYQNSLLKFNFAPILSYIDQHFKDIDIAEVADKFSYNPNYLSNKLKQVTGKSFQKIVLEKRLLYSKELLRNTDYSIETISLESGFNSPSYFFRQFKKFFGKTPNEMRKN